MKNPFVSVVIPTLNEEKYLESTLKALKNQDYKGKYEIIVADGKSKDKTIKIARKYADKVIVVDKKGVAVGRNKGAKIAKGDVLLFLDADTIVLFNMLSEISKAFKNKKVVGATCPVFPTNAKATNFTFYWFYNNFVKMSLKSKKPQVAGICCAYRKDVFEDVGGFDDKLNFSEDYDLSERVGKLGKIVLTENTLVLTSPRRIEAWGRTKAAKKFISFYLNYILAKKSVGKKRYKPIR